MICVPWTRRAKQFQDTSQWAHHIPESMFEYFCHPESSCSILWSVVLVGNPFSPTWNLQEDHLYKQHKRNTTNLCNLRAWLQIFPKFHALTHSLALVVSYVLTLSFSRSFMLSHTPFLLYRNGGDKCGWLLGFALQPHFYNFQIRTRIKTSTLLTWHISSGSTCPKTNGQTHLWHQIYPYLVSVRNDISGFCDEEDGTASSIELGCSILDVTWLDMIQYSKEISDGFTEFITLIGFITSYHTLVVNGILSSG